MSRPSSIPRRRSLLTGGLGLPHQSVGSNSARARQGAEPRRSHLRMAGDAKKNCPVSKVLNAEITLDAKLL